MSTKESSIKPEGESSSKSNEVEVLEYEKPVLISYGDVRDITLGGSPGMGESGSFVTILEP